jgi:3-mercaptopyruvate sulfurtransferase SseA
MIKIKKIVFAISILLFAALACNSVLPQTASRPTPTLIPTLEGSFPRSEAEVPRVSVVDAKAAFENGAAIFVDVRSTESYAAGHIAGAISIPLEVIEIDPAGVALDKNQWIITYCT